MRKRHASQYANFGSLQSNNYQAVKYQKKKKMKLQFGVNPLYFIPY